MVTLRDAINRLFEESVVSPGTAQSARLGGMGIPVDLRETEDQYVIEAVLPGLKPDDIDISVQGNQVTIQGETKQAEEQQGAQYRLRERRFGRFQRTLTLP